MDKKLGGADAGNRIVLGWNQLSGAQQSTYLKEISDHSSLYVEVT
jgi:hypothetical protein